MPHYVFLMARSAPQDVCQLYRELCYAEARGTRPLHGTLYSSAVVRSVRPHHSSHAHKPLGLVVHRS